MCINTSNLLKNHFHVCFLQKETNNPDHQLMVGVISLLEFRNYNLPRLFKGVLSNRFSSSGSLSSALFSL